MLNFTLWVIGIMIIPACIGGLFFALKDKNKHPYIKILCAKAKNKVVTPVWPDDYVFDSIGGNSVWNKNSISDKMYKKLEAVDKRDLRSRERNKYDEWFITHIDDFCKHPEFLAYIARYVYLTSTFIEHLYNHQNDTQLQKNLVSVVHSQIYDAYYANCQNLLYDYLEHWDLAPEIKETIANDPRFEYVKNMYINVRGPL